MILFGRKATHLQLKEFKGKTCDECGKKGIVLSVFQQYFHVLHLPIIPIRKKTATQCLSCRNVKVKKKYDEEMLRESKVLIKSSKTPIWTFSGAIVLGVVYVIRKLFF